MHDSTPPSVVDVGHGIPCVFPQVPTWCIPVSVGESDDRLNPVVMLHVVEVLETGDHGVEVGHCIVSWLDS